MPVESPAVAIAVSQTSTLTDTERTSRTLEIIQRDSTPNRISEARKTGLPAPRGTATRLVQEILARRAAEMAESEAAKDPEL